MPKEHPPGIKDFHHDPATGALLITRGARWKVKLPAMPPRCRSTAFVLPLGPLLLVLTPLVALVGWARWRVGAHTVAQAVVATVLAVVITLGTF